MKNKPIKLKFSTKLLPMKQHLRLVAFNFVLLKFTFTTANINDKKTQWI